jgi:hypothetical protein
MEEGRLKIEDGRWKMGRLKMEDGKLCSCAACPT